MNEWGILEYFHSQLSLIICLNIFILVFSYAMPKELVNDEVIILIFYDFDHTLPLTVLTDFAGFIYELDCLRWIPRSLSFSHLLVTQLEICFRLHE